MRGEVNRLGPKRFQQFRGIEQRADPLGIPDPLFFFHPARLTSISLLLKFLLQLFSVLFAQTVRLGTILTELPLFLELLAALAQNRLAVRSSIDLYIRFSMGK